MNVMVSTIDDRSQTVCNYGTHRHASVRAWLARRPGYQLHFVPTYSSWLNQVKRIDKIISGMPH